MIVKQHFSICSLFQGPGCCSSSDRRCFINGVLMNAQALLTPRWYWRDAQALLMVAKWRLVGAIDAPVPLTPRCFWRSGAIVTPRCYWRLGVIDAPVLLTPRRYWRPGGIDVTPRRNWWLLNKGWLVLLTPRCYLRPVLLTPRCYRRPAGAIDAPDAIDAPVLLTPRYYWRLGAIDAQAPGETAPNLESWGKAMTLAINKWQFRKLSKIFINCIL